MGPPTPIAPRAVDAEHPCDGARPVGLSHSRPAATAHGRTPDCSGPGRPALRPLTTCRWALGLATAVFLASSGLEVAADPTPVADPPPPVRFGRDVKPLLSGRCFQCHGADPSSRQVGLRLDLRESAIADRGGYAAIAPGDPAASELLARIRSDDPEYRMPPPSAKKPALSEADREALTRWIEQGARYEPHWAWVAPARPATPVVHDAGWPRGEIDRFVLARLEAAGIAPAPPADAATLARRVFLDLTGLPPTLEELDAFLADAGVEPAHHAPPVDANRLDAAYERLVERLLTAEPYTMRFAEHLATPWLDAARYADTSGIHMDAGRQTWLWRDWVLEALRDNLPYDRFVTEQLAGDLLPGATTAQRVASGFNRQHVTTDEGGAIDAEYLVEYAVDRVNTTGAVFLGLTAGCARCHDHKYDPLTQEDYYSLFAFFNSNDEPGLYSQVPDPRRALEPFLEVPDIEQDARIDALSSRIGTLGVQLDEPLPGEAEQRDAFLTEAQQRAGVDWSVPRVLAARSSDPGVLLTPDESGAILAGGDMPASEDYLVELATERADLRLLLLECLATPGAESPGGGRASHGNAVLSELALETRPAGSDAAWAPLPVRWAWSDHTQTNLDYEPGLAFDGDHATGWALDGNENAGPRDLVLLTERPFGSAAGTELRLTLSFRSPYAYHSLGHVRVRVSPLADSSTLPVARGRWHRAGPFGAVGTDREGDGVRLYDTAFGPETLTRLDRAIAWPDAAREQAERRLAFDGALVDGAVVTLSDESSATYVARTLWSPDARELPVSLGSDDGLQLYLDGELVFENRVDRGAAADQDATMLALAPGSHLLVMKTVNTGGPGAYFFQPRPGDDVLGGELVSALLPADAVTEEQRDDFTLTWRRQMFAGYRELDDARNAAITELAAERAAVPRTMVMSELPEPRPTYVLRRGQYDQPDESRPVSRRAPSFLPPLPDDAPRDRLGLARWLSAPEQPLFARVAVNRFWELVFGTGLVRTSEDFGVQGEWPSHPELLDWLAVEFRESGWDVRRLLRSLVTSATYRQASLGRPELAEVDPDDRLLARYPRRRLQAEQIRDLALHASGLLVERLGGPSVKPYQPEGLWREVAMPQSNTRLFERDDGDALWRRSLYTYWKRAAPPPALLTLDAPTRESCVIRRQRTNTPLQALVLWNDEQFVEAARALAARTLLETEADTADRDDGTSDGRETATTGTNAADRDAQRITRMLRRCTGQAPDADEQALFADALASFRERFAGDPESAAALLAVGESPLPMTLAPDELAAWTLLANAALNLHATITQD